MSLASVINSFPAPNRTQFSAEGSYLVATSAGMAGGAVGTGATWVAAQTAFVDTGPNFYIVNNEPTQGGKTLHLDFLKMIATAVNTAAVSVQYAVIVDPVQRTVTTNHFTAVTPVCPNSQAANISSPTINVQNSATASVYSASSATSRVVDRGTLGGLLIAGRELGIVFGDLAAMCSVSGAADGAGEPGKIYSSGAPVSVGPGQCASIYIWMPSSSASFNPEFSLGMFFR